MMRVPISLRSRPFGVDIAFGDSNSGAQSYPDTLGTQASGTRTQTSGTGTQKLTESGEEKHGGIGREKIFFPTIVDIQRGSEAS
eukprot:1225633-Amorphochlora_amoeboformis.AAC.1